MSIRQNFLAGLASQLGHPRGLRGKLVGRALNRGNRSPVTAAVDALKLAQGERAMDVGFGGGIGLRLLLDRLGDSGQVTGVDVSTAMVAAAQRRYRSEIADGRLTVIAGSAEQLPVNAGSIDGLITVNTLYFVGELDSAMQEFRRVLSPSGRIAIGVGDPDAMKAMPFTAHGFRLRPPEAISAAAAANGLEMTGHERVGTGPGAFHILIARPQT